MKRYKVIQMGTGNSGMHALRGIIQHPDLELAGLWVHSDQKAGRDAGELCGLGNVGVKATQDTQALLATDADCVCYMKKSATDPTKPGSYGERCVNEICAFLESGKNVVGTAGVTLVYPYVWGPEFVGRFEKACQKGGSSFLWRGIEPGFMCDELPLLLSSVCHRIDSIRGQEIVCYATYNEPEVLRWMGFGSPLPDSAARKKLADFHTRFWCAPSIQIMADALGVKLDGMRGIWEGAVLEEDIEVAIGKVKAGTVGTVRFEVVGIVGGKPRLAVEHVNRLRHDLAPQWAQLEPGGYRVIIEGEPAMNIDLTFTEGDDCVAACVATSARAVNSIPVVCDAPPGVYTFLNLPRPVMGVHRMKTM